MSRSREKPGIDPEFIARVPRDAEDVPEPTLPAALVESAKEAGELLYLENLQDEVRRVARQSDEHWSKGIRSVVQSWFRHKGKRVVVQQWLKEWEEWRKAVKARTELGRALIEHEQLLGEARVKKAQQDAELAKSRAEEAEHKRRAANARRETQHIEEPRTREEEVAYWKEQAKIAEYRRQIRDYERDPEKPKPPPRPLTKEEKREAGMKKWQREMDRLDRDHKNALNQVLAGRPFDKLSDNEKEEYMVRDNMYRDKKRTVQERLRKYL